MCYFPWKLEEYHGVPYDTMQAISLDPTEHVWQDILRFLRSERRHVEMTFTQCWTIDICLYCICLLRPVPLFSQFARPSANPQFEHPMNQHDLRIPESDSWPSAFPPISFWAHQRSGPQLRSYLAGLCRIISGQASEARPNFERVQQYSKMRKRRLGGKTGQWMFENPGCGPVEDHHFCWHVCIISRLPLLILPCKNTSKKTFEKKWGPEESTLPDRSRKLAARGWFGFPEGRWRDPLLQQEWVAFEAMGSLLQGIFWAYSKPIRNII